MKQKIRNYVEISMVTFWTILKRGFIGLVLIIAGWVAYDIFFKQLIHGKSLDQAIAFVGLWLIFAYLFIPRIHRILSKLYLPNYFIGRIKTSDGLLSDPVNLAFIGSEKKLHEAMQNAGWVLADNLNFKSGSKLAACALFGRRYDQAPVSKAYLFNELQSFTYQQSINNKTNARHHVRFWRVPKGWLMPGGHKVDWVAAATFDRAIGISFFTFQFTHRIDSDTDIERDYIVRLLKKKSNPKKVTIIKHYFSAYHHRNGGGDSITTDGSLPIIEL